MEMNQQQQQQQQQQALEGFFDAIEDDSRNVENDDHDDDVIRRRRITSESPAIKNGREYPNILSFDQSGFEMMNCPTTLTTGEFYAAQYDDSIQRQYFDEVISYVEQKLGCDKVVCLQMELQQQQQQDQQGAGPSFMDQQPRNPNDLEQLYKFAKPQTATSSRVADEIAISLAGEHHRYQRYALVSLFRYVEDEDVEHLGQYRHMAILDERSAIKPDDYIPKERVRVVENGSAVAAIERYYSLSPRHAQSHKWYYFPNMKMHNDAILLKHMDSDWTKPSRMCFQMNNIVADPTGTIRKSDGQEGMCFAPSPSRTSVEVRMVCFWETPDSGINSMPSVQQSAVDHRSSAYHDSSSSSVCRLENSWLGKWMHGGDTKVHEWLGKIEELSAGLIDGGGGTDSLSFTELVGRATKCQANTTVAMSRPLDLNDDDNDGLYHPVEAYYGRYTREYSDGYDEEYRIQYLNKFLEVVDSFPTWPPSSKSWVRNEMRRFGHREVDRGIAEITCVIVDDSVGLVGTKNFPPDEKRNIIDFLIRNETYMHVAMTHWAQLAYDMPLQNQQSIIEEDEEEEEDPSAEEAFNDPIVGGPDQSAPMIDLQGSPFEDPMTSNQHPPQYRDDMPAAPPSSLPPPMIANGVEGRLPNPPTMAHPVPTALRRPKYASTMQQDFIPEEEQYNMMRDGDGYYYHHPSDLRLLHHHQQPQQWQRQPPNQQRMMDEAEEGSYALWREQQQQQQQEQHRRRKESRNRRRHRRQQDYHLTDDDDDDDAEGVSLIGAFCQPPAPTIPRHQYQQRAEDRRQQRERRRSMAKKQQLSSDDTRDQYDEVESSRSNSPNSDRYSEGEVSAAVTKTYLHEDDRSLMYSEEDDSSLGNYYPEGRTTTTRDVGGARMMTIPPKTRRESPEYDTPTIVGRENYYDDSNYYTRGSESSYYHHRHQQYSRHSPRTQQQQRSIRRSISNSSGRSSYYYDGNEEESELLYTYSSNSPTYANKQQPPHHHPQQLMSPSPSPEMLIMENSSQPSI
eukprot:scaffold15908_cov132-Cylindrotheca_fusiformis.AAC.2